MTEQKPGRQKNSYVGMGIIFGAAFGALLGIIVGGPYMGMWMAIGPALGIVFGAMMEMAAQRAEANRPRDGEAEPADTGEQAAGQEG